MYILMTKSWGGRSGVRVDDGGIEFADSKVSPGQ